MKIKIKSKEEIEKTLKDSGFHIDGSGAYFSEEMFLECGKQLKAKHYPNGRYSVSTDSSLSLSGIWGWHKDWYEVLESDFTEEGLMDIELMDEMLAYFLEGKWD